MIACAFIFAQFTKVPLDALRTDLICTDSMCLYFCTIDQGSLMSGHMIYFANITFAPQYCTIQGPCMRCVQIGHLICFAALAHSTKVHDMYICISYANNHSWPYCLWELAPPPFYLNTMAGGLSYASGRGLCRGQLIPEANYLA